MKYSIYKHTFKDGRTYIGMTSRKPEERWRSGWGYQEQTRFFEAIMRDGWNNIQHKILEVVETEQEARERELYYILKYESYLPEKGYNVAGRAQAPKLKKVVRCKETGEIFFTCKEAGDKVDRTRAAISNACLKRKPCAGYHWEYIHVLVDNEGNLC